MLAVDEVASQNELYYRATQIKNPRNRALFVFEYLTGGRVGEMVKRTRKMQLERRDIKGKPFIVINNFYTEKNKDYNKRNLVIPIEKEGRFLDLCAEWFNALDMDSILFEIHRKTAWLIVQRIVLGFKEKGLGKYRHMNANHYLRHCRATHLVTIYGMQGQKLNKYLGWSDDRPAKKYVHLIVDDLAESMI